MRLARNGFRYDQESGHGGQSLVFYTISETCLLISIARGEIDCVHFVSICIESLWIVVDLSNRAFLITR